jgi:hypothetical protein
MLYLPNEREAGPETEYKYTLVEPDMQGFDPNALNATMDRLDVELMRAFGIPEKTAIPRVCRISAPAPCEMTSGATPRMNASEVMTMGLNRSVAASTAASW